jgi:hypothetical protein
MTFHGFELRLQRSTGLYRRVDFAYPSNRLAVIVSIIASVLVAGITKDVSIAILCAATTFSAWALGRELDPDRPRTANLSAITVGLILTVLAFNGRLILQDALLGALVTATMMVIARVMTRSTGLAATALDAAALFVVAFGSGLVNPQVAVILVVVATLGIVLDRAFEHHPYLANWCWFGFATFALTALYFFWSSGPWLALTAVVFAVATLNFMLSLRSNPKSLSDLGTRLEPSRIAVANVFVFLAATGLANHGLPFAIVGLLTVGLWRLWLHH